MTKIIFNDNLDTIGTRLLSNKEALTLLKTLKASDTFVFNGITIAFTESALTVPTSHHANYEIYVYGEVVVNG